MSQDNVFQVDVDNENLAPQEGSNNIQEAGIHKDCIFKSLNLVVKPGKKDPNKPYTAAEFVFEDATGRTHTEMYFKPATNESEITFCRKYMEPVEGKMTATRECTKQEMLTLYANEYFYFLSDLADAMRYNVASVQTELKKAKSFEDMTERFKRAVPPSPVTKIAIKLLWENNDKNETSFLKAHVQGIMYYPYKADIFDRHDPSLPTRLQISKYESDKNMTRKYAGKKAPEGTSPVNPAGASKWANSGSGSAGNASTGTQGGEDWF